MAGDIRWVAVPGGWRCWAARHYPRHV